MKPFSDAGLPTFFHPSFLNDFKGNTSFYFMTNEMYILYQHSTSHIYFHSCSRVRYIQCSHPVVLLQFPQVTPGWPTRQLHSCSFFYCHRHSLLQALHLSVCHPPPLLLRDTLSPERLLPPALLTQVSATVLKQRINLVPHKEVYICFHFLKTAFPLPLSVLLPFNSSFEASTGSQMLVATSTYILEYVHFFLSPGLIENEICRLLFLCFSSFLLLFLWFAKEWKCWFL